jgi:hypothetical protein
VAKGKGQVIGEGVAWPVPLVEDGPGRVLPAVAANVQFGDVARPPDRRRNGQRVRERRPTGEPGPPWVEGCPERFL